MGAQALAQRLRAHERLDLRDELGVGAELEIGGDPFLEDAEPQILEPVDLALGERLRLEVGERRAAPQPECLTQESRLLVGLRRPGFPDEPLETGQVELIRVELEHVAARPRQQQPGTEELPQLDDGVLERGRRRPRRVLAPQLVDQPLRRDGLVRAQEQQRQDRALVPPAQRDGRSVVEHLERAEDPELEHSPVVTGHTNF